MKVAIFGASGFMGYDLLKLLMAEDDFEPIVYASSPKNLSNVARHDVPIRYVPYKALAEEKLDQDVELLINFAHPFGAREGMNPAAQAEAFRKFLIAARQRNPALRMVHLSTLSVYEPFAPGREFTEEDAPNPPSSDGYATSKWQIERSLRQLPDAENWQVILRPTFVYGPFGRPWTDRLITLFQTEKEIPYFDLSGKLQPVYVGDISAFIRDRLRDFRPGIYNLGGPETMNWTQFLKVFEEMVGGGKLVERKDLAPKEAPAPGKPAKPKGKMGAYVDDFKTLMQYCTTQDSFNRLVYPISSKFPKRIVTRVHSFLGTSYDTVKVGAMVDDKQPKYNKTFLTPFFAEDRLVSMKKVREMFPEFRLTSVEENRATLEEYFAFRFGGAMLKGKEVGHG